jgi:hypothetical protein
MTANGRKPPEAKLRDACGTGARLVVGRGVETGRTRDTSAHNLLATVRQQQLLTDKSEFVNIAVPWLEQNYEMLAERARGLLSGEVSRPDEQRDTSAHNLMATVFNVKSSIARS